MEIVRGGLTDASPCWASDIVLVRLFPLECKIQAHSHYNRGRGRLRRSRREYELEIGLNGQVACEHRLVGEFADHLVMGTQTATGIIPQIRTKLRMTETEAHDVAR